MEITPLFISDLSKFGVDLYIQKPTGEKEHIVKNEMLEEGKKNSRKDIPAQLHWKDRKAE
jgi:hypothetical protein